MVGALRDLSGWPWMTRSHAGNEREKGCEYRDNECKNKWKKKKKTQYCGHQCGNTVELGAGWLLRLIERAKKEKLLNDSMS